PAAGEQPPSTDQPAADQTPAPPADQQGRQRGGGRDPQRGQGAQKRPRRDRPPREGQGQGRRERGRPQREKGPLPFPELRAAAESIRDVLGQRQVLRDAFSLLADKERQDLSRLVSEDGDWRVRARNIAAGSLGAGRLGKAIAAQQVAMANIEDLWQLTLSKEEAAERAARIRTARQRDERRAQRQAEREQRSDRVSRADLEKAQDGRVGAQIRIVVAGERRERRKK